MSIMLILSTAIDVSFIYRKMSAMNINYLLIKIKQVIAKCSRFMLINIDVNMSNIPISFRNEQLPNFKMGYHDERLRRRKNILELNNDFADAIVM